MDYEQQVRRARRRRQDLRGPDAAIPACGLRGGAGPGAGSIRGGMVRAAKPCGPGGVSGLAACIVRHQAFRVLRKRTLPTVPLVEAEDLPGEAVPADRLLEQRRQSAMALAAIAGLPDRLREAATLFFIHECSHQDIAVFLGLPVATVNNRLHAARSKLKERMLTMVTETLHSRALPDDFANRIGRLLDARGCVVEALFDPNAPP